MMCSLTWPERDLQEQAHIDALVDDLDAAHAPESSTSAHSR